MQGLKARSCWLRLRLMSVQAFLRPAPLAPIEIGPWLPPLAPRAHLAAVLEIAPLTTFAELSLSPQILNTLNAKGYQSPTPIQARCIPPALEGRDVLGCAQTGTGKTAAFSLPLIERLMARSQRIGPKPDGEQSRRRARALILAPTRELAAQIDDCLRTYSAGARLRTVVIYGGVKQNQQVRQLRAGVEVIVATPGRLLDLMEQGYVDLRSVEVLVLDEADRMLDMGFIDPIRRIASEVPAERQTLFFSATMPPKIKSLASSMLHDPVHVSIAPAAMTTPKIDQSLYHIAGEHKTALLKHLLEEDGVQRGVVFTKTKHGADRLAKSLSADGITAAAIHGNRSQSQRERTLDGFRNGKFRVLVATDVAARGLDVDGITYVFNFNLPMEAEAYVHRIGRTGRAGATGRAISFCSREERGLLRDIERLTTKPIDTAEVPVVLGLSAEQLNAPAKASAGTRSARTKPPAPRPKLARPARASRTDASAVEAKPRRSRRGKRRDNAQADHRAGSRNRQRSKTSQRS